MNAKLKIPVLVLNASFEPINICAARRAIVLLAKGVASTEEFSATVMIHSANASMPLPSVIRLHSYRRVPRQTRALSRKNILMRDRYTCQYCQQQFPPAKLTLDHVIPRSLGGESSWINLVAACFNCNHKKGNKTPEEAGLVLAKKPAPFTLHTSRHLMRQLGQDDELWRRYLYF